MANSSNITDLQCINYQGLDGPYDKILFTFYSLIIITSLLGNLLVVVIVQKSKSMHTFTNYLICNCAFTDMIKMVPAVIDILEILPVVEWRLSMRFCTFWYAFIILTLASANITLTITSIERYFAVFTPFKKKFTKNMLYFIIPLIWLVSIAFATPGNFILTIMNVNLKGPVYMKLWTSQQLQNVAFQIYTPVVFVFLYVLPLAVIGVMCTVIGRRLYLVGKPKNSSVQISFRNRSDSKEDIFELSTQLTKEVGNIAHAKQRATRAKGYHKDYIIKMLSAVLMLSTLSWFPLFAIQFFMVFQKHSRCVSLLPHWLIVVGFFLPYLESAIKPLIYIGYSRSYRRGLSRLSQRSRNSSENNATKSRRQSSKSLMDKQSKTSALY